METPKQSSNARVAAILALIVAFVVIMVLIVSSLAGSDSGDDGANRAGQRQSNSKESKRSERKIYVVKPGDCCLSQIAEKTGIDVDVLVQLNPNLDPQAIHSGDRVKLR
jgi:LysM repeat protein